MCGFLGLFTRRDAAPEMVDGLLVLQHRGQDAAGATTFDGETFHTVRGAGLVKDVFDEHAIAQLPGRFAIGHTRYPTVGTGTAKDAQPLYTNHPYGIAMAHNGNVTNFPEVKASLQKADNRRLGTTCDVEAILNVFAAALGRNTQGRFTDQVVAAMDEVFQRVRGSYSGVALVGGKGMVAFRDPFGIKPAILGRRAAGKAYEYAVVSESATLNVLGFEVIGDLDPGEVVVITPRGELQRRTVGGPHKTKHRPCVFEFVYFARPDSVIDDISVYRARLRLGEALAKRVRERKLKPDVVVPVPDSSRPAALECARVLNVRYREGLLKNRYVGRTFIMPDQAQRAKNVRAKLTTLPMELEGKRVLLVDDSIVRGTTTRAVVEMVREAGAKAVYVAVSSPRITHPCVYGIDMQTRNEFLARADRSDSEIAQRLGAEAVVYMTVDDLTTAVRGPTERVQHFCRACMDGKYPTGDVTEDVLQSIESERNATQRQAQRSAARRRRSARAAGAPRVGPNAPRP